jgi:exopolyphosphatase/guanosine-5'-triphosphate,3'-diphosphate pyrophosphatase
MRVAAIDLGSNSFHMLIVEILGPTSFETVLREKMMIQLGKTALVSGRLDSEAMARGLQCLDEFRRMALARRVERTLAVATSAVREAENGEEFLHRAGAESGISVRVISGREEARLVHLAVSRHIDLRQDRTLIIDIGGGSVELIAANAGRIFYATSLKLGFLRLHGRFITSDPLQRREERSLSRFIRGSLVTPLASIRRQNVQRVIATSGSATTLLRIAQQRRGGSVGFDAQATNVSREEIRAILAEMLRLPAMECAEKFDLDPLRSTYLPTALLCLDAALEGVGLRELTVCPAALREGIIYDFLARTKPHAFVQKSTRDLRQQSVIDLATRCGYPGEHSHKVAFLSGQIFRQTRHLHGLGEVEAKLLEYGCILHDIGYHIGYSKHHKHGYYLVMSCDLHGFTPEERTILALLVRYHRRALPKPAHPEFAALPARARTIVKYLSSILRIADGLDQSHFSNVARIRCRSRKKNLQFTLVTNARHADIHLDLYMAKRHARYFEKLFGVMTSFVAARPRAQRAAGEPKVGD